eukprot:5394731-Pyramimonas_sp.AAC.1
MAEVSGGSFVCERIARKSHTGVFFPMGPAAHVMNPSGSSECCSCRHFWVPEAGIWGSLRRGCPNGFAMWPFDNAPVLAEAATAPRKTDARVLPRRKE